MRKLYRILIILLYCTSSCTVLQWRETDEELTERYEQIGVSTQINYHQIDDLNKSIRSFAITNTSKKKINIVFLHGSPSSISAWDSYFIDTTLTKATNIYAIDRPGYGYSDFGEEVPSIDIQTQLVNKVLTDLELDEIILIGASYGGPLAARIALFNPQVKGVIMISPAIDPDNEKDIWGARLTQWKLTRWLVPTSYRVAGDEKTVHAQELKKIASDWKLLKIPIAHIHGDADKVVPYENIFYTETTFENIKTTTVPGAGHEISWKKPELVKPLIYEMIKTISQEF